MNIMAAAGSAATTPPADAVMPVRAADAIAPGTALPSHYRLCFGCGADHEAGLRLRVAPGPGLAVTGEFTVGEHHQGAPGLAHGGVLASALDEVMGALNWLLMAPAVTARLEIDYAAPVPVGTALHLAAMIIGQSGRKVYCVAEGRSGDAGGRLLVSARGLFLQVPLEHFHEHGRPEDVRGAAAGRSGSPQRPWLEISP